MDAAGIARALSRFGAGGPWDLVVLVDTSPTMEIWRDTVRATLRLLRRLPAFRDVRSMPLGDAAGVRPAARAAHARGLCLVLTDGLGDHWTLPATAEQLRRLGQSVPLAVVNLLPRPVWYLAMLPTARVHLLNPGPGRPNRALRLRRQDRTVESPAPRPYDVPVPVLELDPRWLDAWARLVTGRNGGWIPLAALRPPTPPDPPTPHDPRAADPTVGEPADADTAAPVGTGFGVGSGVDGGVGADGGTQVASGAAVDAAATVSAFRAAASPEAQRLAVLLAAAPLTPAIVQAVQRLVPRSGPQHLAELLAHGILFPTEQPPLSHAFAPGVREALLGLGRRRDAVRVWRLVNAVRALGQPDFVRLLDEPETAPLPTPTAGTLPFLRVLHTVLTVLGGRYAGPAGRLGHALSELGGEQPEQTTQHGDRPTTPHHHPQAIRQTSHEDPSGGPPGLSRGDDSRSGGGQMSTPEVNPARPRDPFAAPAIWGNIPPRNRNFTGRKQLLATLHERLQAGTTAVLPEAMHGLGGIGKSQLAVEYLYLHQGEYDLVWWIPAERTPQITQSLSELGRRLGLAVQSEPGTVVAAVIDALRRGDPYGRWMLVFDNAENPEQIAPYLPTSGSGAILITSRYPHWERVARQLEVNVFTREESKELLRRRGEDLTDDEADRLAQALGDLPLAIEQAAAWRAETGMPADEYLRLFKEKQSDLLTFSPPYDYQKSVATAWNVSLDHVETINPAAIQLLQICAFYAPEPIPRWLFAGARRGPIAAEIDAALADEMRLSLAIREIQRYSLARIDPRSKALQMHRLVQSVLTTRMTAMQQEKMRQGAHMLLSAADPRNPESSTSWERYAELYPHVFASGAIESADPWVRDLVINVAKYLQRWGDHAAALEFTQKAYEAWKNQFGEEEPYTLTMAWWLGFVLFTMGHYAEAAELNARSLALHDRMSPDGRRPSRPSEIREERLNAMSAVAADLRVQGDFARALEISDEVYRLSERAFDEDDPVTLNAAHNLGVSLRLVGDFEKAYELDRRTWDRKAELFGTDHEQTLLTRVGLSIDQRELGRYDHARNRQEEVVSIYHRLLGDTNQATLHARRVLAVARRKAGDHLGARELSERTLELMQRRFGEEHPDTMASALAVSVDLRHTGDLDGAVLLGRRTAERYRERLGPAHPHSLSASANLAITLRLLGDPETALSLDLAAYQGLVDRLGDDHVLALVCETNLGSDLSALGRHEEARDRSADAKTRSERVLGPDHPSTLAAAANLALDLRALGQEQEALALHAHTMDLMVQTLGRNHPATAELGDWIRANCYIDPLPL